MLTLFIAFLFIYFIEFSDSLTSAMFWTSQFSLCLVKKEEKLLSLIFYTLPPALAPSYAGVVRGTRGLGYWICGWGKFFLYRRQRGRQGSNLDGIFKLSPTLP